MKIFVKARRAQSVNDFETWKEGGVVPTLNAFDNGGDSRATVLMIFEATRVEDTRLHKVCPTVARYWGTGGARVLTLQSHQPSVQSHHAQLFIAQTAIVRRLTPTECERLQGFPDGWTDGQADSHRYKQMGNAVAVPVVEWIVKRLVNVT